MWQAIIWTNNGVVYWCIYTSLSPSELTIWRWANNIFPKFHWNKPALVQAMAKHLTGKNPIAEPMMAWFTDTYSQYVVIPILLVCNRMHLIISHSMLYMEEYGVLSISFLWNSSRNNGIKWYCGMFHLTLNVQGLSYPGLNKSISWLLMPWLLASPGHQQPWYWLCKLGLTWGRISTNFVMTVLRNDRNCEYMFLFLLKNLAYKAYKELITYMHYA